MGNRYSVEVSSAAPHDELAACSRSWTKSPRFHVLSEPEPSSGGLPESNPKCQADARFRCCYRHDYGALATRRKIPRKNGSEKPATNP
jgi:hypothetical protein